MAAHQAPPSLGFSRQEYWSGYPTWQAELERRWVLAGELGLTAACRELVQAFGSVPILAHAAAGTPPGLSVQPWPFNSPLTTLIY